jgi:hypothetical protein
MNPTALPTLVVIKIGKNPIGELEISVAPMTSTTSLGEGGKIFSIKAKKNKTR